MSVARNEEVIRQQFQHYKRFRIFERFLKFVEIGSADKCWEWNGAKDKNENHNYGFFVWDKRKLIQAHIASYRLFVGKTHGLCVCHSCDNPPCVNPNHLWLGTHSQNVQDMVKKGRTNAPSGSKHWNSKLTLEKVEDIRKLAEDGKSHTEIAKLFGVCRTEVSKLIANQLWKN